jgi:hypothetical protein
LHGDYKRIVNVGEPALLGAQACSSATGPIMDSSILNAGNSSMLSMGERKRKIQNAH